MLNFNSCLATQIQHFIELRRLSGTNYHAQAVLLSYFDHFLTDHSWRGTNITCEIIDDYQCSFIALAPRSRTNRLSVVKQFCEYYAASNPQSYVPEPIKNISSRTAYKPYIYTLGEVQELMSATARLNPTDSLRPHTIRTLLGLLYTTGIRIGEALALNLQNFYQDEARLFIADGKFHKARWIPLATSTCTAIAAYIQKRCKYTLCSPESPLFINLRNHRLRHRTINHDFHLLLKYIGIARTKKPFPRIHDLRHTFAVSRTLSWYRDGLNVNALLPSLATYMGHVCIASTQIYLQPTEELLKQVNQRFYHHYLEQVKPAGEVSWDIH
ncbi:MAG: tyrosine-type recombinase/integrase [Alteromonadaceae bacterium]|nr:tyrosine-type recombinase/integrase [Alteromonadaceae bacterium]